MTMTQNEAQMLPRWLGYYARELGPANVVVLDDNSTDGSTKSLDCSVVRLPSGQWKGDWMQGRRTLVNSFARGLLQVYDVVIFTDVDEFLLPDPAKYDGLADYVARRADQSVLAGVGLNVIHDAANEPPIDPAAPILKQRSLVKFVPVMCKPSIKREPLEWLAGFHGIRSRFSIDPDLLLLHMKYHDEQHLRRVAELRHHTFVTHERGGQSSAWTHEADALVSRMRRWVDGDPVGTLDTQRLSLPVPQPARGEGFFRVAGNQLSAMEDNELLQLPQRFLTGAF
jgi:hypothetical protein